MLSALYASSRLILPKSLEEGKDHDLRDEDLRHREVSRQESMRKKQVSHPSRPSFPRPFSLPETTQLIWADSDPYNFKSLIGPPQTLLGVSGGEDLRGCAAMEWLGG